MSLWSSQGTEMMAKGFEGAVVQCKAVDQGALPKARLLYPNLSTKN